MAVAESCIVGGLGARVSGEFGERWDAGLFGEGQSRVLVTVSEERVDELGEVCGVEGAPWGVVGMVGGEGFLDVAVGELGEAYGGGISGALGEIAR